jgi:hypothetical protein
VRNLAKNKRYIIKYPGIDDLRVDAYISCDGFVIEAISIHDDGKGFDHLSIPADCIIIDRNPPMLLEDFLAEERECETRVKNIRKTRKQIQDMADKQMEDLPNKMAQAIEDVVIQEEEPEGYR